ncbi:MAG: homoserine O-acetyltransferase [Chitinophagales bacterium]|nr:homoserine O-acetyltransferase [Chitinophagales bacterium]MCZ2392673.1 homoserine O-acetyltransferase [Chitinophagales bacterium]
MSVKTLSYPTPFPLDCGEVLPSIDIAYHTFGQLNEDKSNVVWICHAFSANSDPSDWWPGMVGEGKYFDPKKYFIVCANMLGSCYGTTGPLSIHPDSKEPYYGEFPIVTVRDMVRSLIILRKYLGIEKIWFSLGFSMGGQQLLEWLIMEPDLIENALLGATNIQHSPWGIAFNESQRMAIEADHTFGEKNQYAGAKGMGVARSIGLISYRNYQAYNQTQKEDTNELLSHFKACSYQRYQGEKLIKRFNAYSYYRLSQAMDNHNIMRGRASNPEEILSQIKTRTLVLGIDSDYLFPIQEQELLAKYIPNHQFVRINSNYGHDGFLIEFEKISIVLNHFLGFA